MSTSMSLPQLIAAGDEDAIAGFRDAQIRKVRAYCAVACAPALVDEACDAAFVDFLGRVLTAPDERQLEHVLLKATRSAAAPRSEPPASTDAPRRDLCAAVPELLAAKANGELPDEQALAAHVKHCTGCQTSAALLERAEAAFGISSGWEMPTDSEPGAESPAPEAERALGPQPRPQSQPQPQPQPKPQPQSQPQPQPPTVRARRGGIVGAAKRVGRQLGGR